MAGTDVPTPCANLVLPAWELFIPGIEAGEIYKYEILNANNEWTMKADPMERSHEIPPRTGSIVVESTMNGMMPIGWPNARPATRITDRSASMR